MNSRNKETAVLTRVESKPRSIHTHFSSCRYQHSTITLSRLRSRIGKKYHILLLTVPPLHGRPSHRSLFVHTFTQLRLQLLPALQKPTSSLIRSRKKQHLQYRHEIEGKTPDLSSTLHVPPMLSYLLLLAQDSTTTSQEAYPMV